MQLWKNYYKKNNIVKYYAKLHQCNISMQNEDMTTDQDTFALPLHDLQDAQFFYQQLKLTYEDDRNITILHKRLEQLEQMIQVLFLLGYKNIADLYLAVRQQNTIHFEQMQRHTVCTLSGITSRNALCVGNILFVHQKYQKFATCLWMVLHIKQIEKQRKNNRATKKEKIPFQHSEIYRKSFLHLFQSLCTSYDQIIKHKHIKSIRLDEDKHVLQIL